jgi:hypothetical protein
MRAPRRFIACGTLACMTLAAGGCQGADSSWHEPIHPPPTLESVAPGDLTTSFGSAGFELLVNNWGSPVGTNLLDDIARSMSLVTWPEATPVDATTTFVDTTGRRGEDQYAHVTLAPTFPLSERWYALSVALPVDVAWPTYSTLLERQAGPGIARFRVGSEPLLTTVRYVSKSLDIQVFDIGFSEPVTGSAGLLDISFADGGSLNCQPAAAVVNGRGARFTCGATIDPVRDIQVEARPGLSSSTSGAPLDAGAPLRIVIRRADWMNFGTNGMVWKTPRP